jgi:hypothetical protein
MTSVRSVCRVAPAVLFAAVLPLTVAPSVSAQKKGSKEVMKIGKVEIGKPAPAIELPATSIETVLPGKKGAKTLKLADLKGKNVVLYFYPKALTGG